MLNYIWITRIQKCGLQAAQVGCQLASDFQGQRRSAASQAYLLYPLTLLTSIFKSRHWHSSELGCSKDSPETPALTCHPAPLLWAAEAVLPCQDPAVQLSRPAAGPQAAAARHCHTKHTCPDAAYL